MIKLYNSLTKQKEEFTPIEPGKVSMYHCGPTVYNTAHIGNLRVVHHADVLRRTMEYLGYDVRQVMNVTDVGHLSSNDDSGDDKMTRAVKNAGLPITLENMIVVGQQFTDQYIRDIKRLGAQQPHLIPKASDHIAENIAIIEKLEAKSLTYTTSDGVYFENSILGRVRKTWRYYHQYRGTTY